MRRNSILETIREKLLVSNGVLYPSHDVHPPSPIKYMQACNMFLDHGWKFCTKSPYTNDLVAYFGKPGLEDGKFFVQYFQRKYKKYKKERIKLHLA